MEHSGPGAAPVAIETTARNTIDAGRVSADDRHALRGILVRAGALEENQSKTGYGEDSWNSAAIEGRAGEVRDLPLGGGHVLRYVSCFSTHLTHKPVSYVFYAFREWASLKALTATYVLLRGKIGAAPKSSKALC